MAKSNKDSNGKATNRSEAIRGMIAEHPTASSKEIIAFLAEKGTHVSPTLVYYIRSKQNHEKRKEKRARVAETTQRTGMNNPVELVARVKQLARDLGGIGNLKNLVDLLAE